MLEKDLTSITRMWILNRAVLADLYQRGQITKQDVQIGREAADYKLKSAIASLFQSTTEI